jgi:hypothetical protein
MATQIECPKCGRVGTTAKDLLPGKGVRCPACGEALKVPEGSVWIALESPVINLEPAQEPRDIEYRGTGVNLGISLDESGDMEEGRPGKSESYRPVYRLRTMLARQRRRIYRNGIFIGAVLSIVVVCIVATFFSLRNYLGDPSLKHVTTLNHKLNQKEQFKPQEIIKKIIVETKYDYSKLILLDSAQAPKGEAESLTFSPDGSLLAVGAGWFAKSSGGPGPEPPSFGQIKCWRVPSLELQQTIER